jgi:hypothetical protein
MMPATQIPRDRYGRPLIVPANGGKPVAYRRCTTFIDVLEDRFALEKWKQRQVAAGLAARPDLVLKAASAAGDKTVLNQVCDAAYEAAESSAAATSGTAVHAITEQIDRGFEVTIPPSIQADIDAYRAATAELHMAEIEVFVVDDERKVAGTFDRIVEHGGRRYVADIKTGRIDYGQGKIAMQLAVYAGARRYNPITFARDRLHCERDWGLVIHLPVGAGECTLWWVNLADGRAGIDTAQRIWSWRASAHHFARQFVPLADRIQAAGDVDALTRLWTVHQNEWTDTHTAAAAAKKQKLLTHGG